jgi:hypothetical protein
MVLQPRGQPSLCIINVFQNCRHIVIDYEPPLMRFGLQRKRCYSSGFWQPEDGDSMFLRNVESKPGKATISSQVDASLHIPQLT